MFGLRYHVVTVFSMLIMLGLGFLFGATSGFGPSIVRSQTKTLSKLNGTLTNLVQDNQRDQTLVRQNEDAITELTPLLVNGKLARKRIAIVQLGDYPSAAQDATQSVAAAGGVVVSTMIVNNHLGLLDDSKRRRIAGPNEDLNTLYHPLAAVFRAGTAARPDLQADMDVLQNSGIIDYSGDYSQPVSAVLVVGGWSDDPTDDAPVSPDQVATPPPASMSAFVPATSSENEIALINTLVSGSAAPLTIVGCEDSEASYSSVADFLKTGIASVDCIDLPIGQLDLPFALIGQRAAYGIKSPSTLLIPKSLGSATNTGASD